MRGQDLKTHRHISTLVIGFLLFCLNGCAHQTTGLSTEQTGGAEANSSKNSCNAGKDAISGNRAQAAYRISDDAELDEISAEDAAESDDKQGDRINFGGKNQKILDEALDFCQQAQEYRFKGQADKALSALDQAYALIIQVDTFNRPRLIQQKEDLRYLITRRIQDIYGSRNVAAKGSYNAIPSVMNDYVKAEIDLLTTGCEKDFFINAYQRSGRYFKYVEGELAKEGLPVELAWLPLIESGYNVRAMSPARALGLWQFIPSTGYRFGLNRDKYVDERMDPYKSTKAAISYLKELHQLFGDWETVLAAYNCGEGRVLRVLNTQSINYLDNFWDLYEKLPRETARYVPRFHATLHIIQNLKKYGLMDVHPETAVVFDTVPVSRQLQIKNIAETTGIDESVLKRLNPELRYGIIPGDNYPFKIPQGESEQLLAKLDTIPEAINVPKEEVDSEKPSGYSEKLASHKVKRGETLASLAKRYHTTTQSILQLNKLKKTSKIKAGMVLMVPSHTPALAAKAPAKQLAKATAPAKTASKTVTKAETKPQQLAKASDTHAKLAPAETKHASSNKPETAHTVTYVVKSGDSLYNIASRYGVTPKKIQEANKLKSSTIEVGQRLTIPGATKTASVEPSLKKYQVKQGENAFSIAAGHNMPVDRFLSINNLSSASKIFPGQKVYVE